jgi:hypothetical protein
MDGLVYSAKSGNDWTENDLREHNIQIQYEDVATFFGDSNLPLPEANEEILTTLEAEDMSSTPNAKLIRLLDRAVIPAPDREGSAVRDFAVQLFDVLGYMGWNVVTRTRRSIPYLICGEWRVTMADVCLIDCLQDDDIILVVQEDKRVHSEGLPDPRPQLIGKAIAAFYHDNNRRLAAGEPAIESKACDSYKFVGMAPLNRLVGHAWHRLSRYNAHLLQDPCHQQPCAACAARDISVGPHRCFCPSA